MDTRVGTLDKLIERDSLLKLNNQGQEERKEEEESDQVLVRVLINHSSALARGRVQR